MHRPVVEKIDEEIKGLKMSEKQALENLYFARARADAVRKRLESLLELKAKMAQGQMEFDLRPWPDAG